MDKKDRPVGREKRVGTGGGEVEKRGEGLGGKTGGPVGNAGGYGDRTEDTPSQPAGGLERTPGGTASGSGSRALGGGSSKLIIVLLVLAVIYYIYNSSSNTGTNTTGGLQPGTQTSTTTFVDKGAYAVNTNVSSLARAKRTVLLGNGQDKATVMVYMCGTDLEANGGMATADLQEMLNARISDKVNIVVETGGAAKWQNNIISNRTNQRYLVTAAGLKLIEDNLGRKSMVDPDTLSDFIRYSKANYPADRYLLVMWDHGGGSLSGYGYDQIYPNDGMTLDEIATALKNGGCAFDLVGFDACLMATLETAMVLEPYADYMIASEEVEPGNGWYYTNWITALSENTSIATIDLGKKLIDDYVQDVKAKTPQSQATLSLIDLAELKGTVPASFAARAGTKEFAASSRINQIDLVHFAQNLDTIESKSFADVLRSCIKYNRTSANITNSNGVSIFFPYGRLSKLSSMLETYDDIGMDDEYSKCIRSFASVNAGGQAVSSGSGSPLETLLGGLSGSATQSAPATGFSGSDAVGLLLNTFLSGGDFSSITGRAGGSSEWLDLDRIKNSAQYYEKNRFDAAALVITEKNKQRVLALTEEQWGLIQHMEMNVFLDDGEGFIDLGLDNVYEYNKDGDLIMEYDGTWLALNGHIVSYYMETDDRYGETYSTKGRVPALLNGQLVDIIIVFDNETPYGKVLGAQVIYDAETQTETIAKGLLDIAAGDKIDFLCDYYTYDGDYSDTYYLGEQYTATGEWKIENLSVGRNKYQMTYRLTDIYDNKYWTPSITG
jgi:Clostripain family